MSIDWTKPVRWIASKGKKLSVIPYAYKLAILKDDEMGAFYLCEKNGRTHRIGNAALTVLFGDSPCVENYDPDPVQPYTIETFPHGRTSRSFNIAELNDGGLKIDDRKLIEIVVGRDGTVMIRDDTGGRWTFEYVAKYGKWSDGSPMGIVK